MIQNPLFYDLLPFAILFSHIAFTLTIGVYLILNLQWYNYNISRVLFKHHKQLWHFLLFLVPLSAYFFTSYFFWLFFYLTYLPLFYRWIKRLDKPLIFTSRVKRFFIYLFVFSISIHISAFTQSIENVQLLSIISLVLSITSMNINEHFLFIRYKKLAQNKLSAMPNLQIIQITASYGKTSIKNFIYEFLSKKFNTYQTPKSVNTINGIIKDINDNLPTNTQIYIAESGARVKNDIAVITNFLNPHFVVLGKIGLQHIEYFNTLDNIIFAKSRILYSNRLQKAYIHHQNILGDYDILDAKQKEFYPNNLEIISSTLNNTKFALHINHEQKEFLTNILGELNPENISVAISIALDFGIDIDTITSTTRNLSFVPHRLEKIENMGKIILDDSYNSNLYGMLCAINLAKQHKGRKIIVTCGLVESDDASNIQIAKQIDEVFDIAIITSKLNQEILDKNITNIQKFILQDKNGLESLLSSLSSRGDIILFANDAPNYI